MNCKKLFPFRVGTTSYIIPDEVIPNIEYLKDKVDDVEIVLFESDEISNLPSANEIKSLRHIGDDNDLTYSIHLPLDVYLGHFEEKVRRASVEKCLRIIDLTLSLSPSAYVMHCEAGLGINVNAFREKDLQRFRGNFLASMELLLEHGSLAPADICVETLNYPIQMITPVIEQFGLSMTLDIGHLELYGFPVREHLDRYLPLVRVLHMHGVKEGKDHNGLQYMRPEILDMVMQVLFNNPDPQRVFTVEVFSENDFKTSCCELKRFVK